MVATLASGAGVSTVGLGAAAGKQSLSRRWRLRTF